MFYVKSTDGVKLAVYEYNPCGRRTVVLVHGWPLSHKIFEYQIELLTRHDFRVIALDLRGFGKSDAPASGYCYDQMAADLYCVVKTCNLCCFALAGFSMGGAVALRYMRKYRGWGVCKLLLLAAAAPSWTQRPGYPCGLSRDYVDSLIELAQTDRPQLAKQFAHCQLFAGEHPESVKDWFEDIALSASGVGTVQSLYALRDEDGRRDLDCVHVPTTIIHGAKDTVVSKALAEYQHEAIEGSRLYTLDCSGHGVMYDQLALFNKYFLDGLLN